MHPRVCRDISGHELGAIPMASALWSSASLLCHCTWPILWFDRDIVSLEGIHLGPEDIYISLVPFHFWFCFDRSMLACLQPRFHAPWSGGKTLTGVFKKNLRCHWVLVCPSGPVVLGSIIWPQNISTVLCLPRHQTSSGRREPQRNKQWE